MRANHARQGLLLVTVLVLVFTDVSVNCTACASISCIDFVSGLCARSAQYDPLH